jgi:hypothetical protein
MGYLYPLWLFVAAVFFYFAYISWRHSGSALRPFRFRHRGGGEDDPGKEQEIDPYLQEFISDWNRYLDSMNSSNRARNRAAAVGFFVTGICALISMFVLIPR